MAPAYLIALLATVLASWPVVVVGWSLPDRCFDRYGPFRASLTTLLLVTPMPMIATLWAMTDLPVAELPGGLALAWILISLSVVDVRTHTLPNCLTVPLIAIGLVNHAAMSSYNIDAAISVALQNGSAAALGYATLAFVAFVYRALRKNEGLGLGDAKLFAAAGAWLGIGALPSVLLVAAVAALMVTIGKACISRKRQLDRVAPIPFGPYLAGGTWLVFLYGPLAIN